MQLLSLVLAVLCFVQEEPVKADLLSHTDMQAQMPALLDRANLLVRDCPDMTDGGPAYCPLSQSHALPRMPGMVS